MHNPPRILIVDDHEINRDILATRLGMHGYELLQAADGEEALAAAREHLPDLLLLDVMMPKLDGIEVCRRLKGDATLPFMPIILVTAKADSKDVVAGLEAGADEYLTKPLDQLALVARVKSVLRLKELHDKVQAQATSSRAGTARSKSVSTSSCSRSSGSAVSSASCRRKSRSLSCRPAARSCWRAAAARSRRCSAICVASRPSPKPPSPKR